jgi:hypothetical protein
VNEDVLNMPNRLSATLKLFFPGSIQITASQIICPKHYEPPKGKKGGMTHINTRCQSCQNFSSPSLTPEKS